jgi:alkylated DNA repair protein alkB family protein 7
VIHNYRESLITALPPTADAELARILSRLYALVPGLSVSADASPAHLPPEGSSTHALHLAPEGAILAHVDNLDASGGTIVGASLGAARILRLDRDGAGFDVLLPSGSVYMQKGAVRYEYTHAVLGFGESRWEGVPLPRGHRVSFMVRVSALQIGLTAGRARPPRTVVDHYPYST